MWIESRLPTQLVSSYAKSSFSPKPPPNAPINIPTTPQAMVTAPESGGSTDVTIFM